MTILIVAEICFWTERMLPQFLFKTILVVWLFRFSENIMKKNEHINTQWSSCISAYI